MLSAAYGSPRHDNKDDPLDELVFIVLSQMTTHHSFGRVYDRLKARYSTWDQFAIVPMRTIRATIKDAGLSNQKAPRLKLILRRLRKDFGRITLDPLREWSAAQAESYLTSLPGVGTKTAKCVQMYALGHQVLPVDTHVWRVARRLGLVPHSVSYSRIHAALEKVVAPMDRYSFHVNAIAHGRALCLPHQPRCNRCPLRGFCRFPDAG